MSGTWYDYRLMFPISGIASAVSFLNQVRAAGFMGGAGALPDNMLGDPRDMNGAIVGPSDPARVFNGRPGSAAAGDSTMMYLHVRSPVSQAQAAATQAALGITPAAFGIVPSDPIVSAAVLGTWE